jgi:hypothetical protein
MWKEAIVVKFKIGIYSQPGFLETKLKRRSVSNINTKKFENSPAGILDARMKGTYCYSVAFF